MTTFTATFADGSTATRTSDTHYTHASRTEGGKVRFHTSAAAAKRTAGRFGEVTTTDAPAAAAPAAAATTWRVSFADGSTADFTVDCPPAAFAAARAAHPDRRATGATLVR